MIDRSRGHISTGCWQSHTLEICRSSPWRKQIKLRGLYIFNGWSGLAENLKAFVVFAHLLNSTGWGRVGKTPFEFDMRSKNEENQSNDKLTNGGITFRISLNCSPFHLGWSSDAAFAKRSWAWNSIQSLPAYQPTWKWAEKRKNMKWPLRSLSGKQFTEIISKITIFIFILSWRLCNTRIEIQTNWIYPAS